MGSRVQLFADIRHDARVDGLSIRELARKHGVHRRTVRQALASAEPPPRKTPVRTAPRLDPYKPAIDQACRRLRLPTIRSVVDEAITTATKEQLTYQGFLAELLLAEVDDRDRRS